MINPAWLFTLASILAAFGILHAFKKLMTGIQTQIEQNQLNTETLQQQQTRYFIRVAIMEIIPIVLIILGFVFKDKTSYSIAESIIPLIIIIGLILFALANVLLIRNDTLANLNESSEIKGYITNLVFVGIATIMGIPIICLISFFMNS